MIKKLPAKPSLPRPPQTELRAMQNPYEGPAFGGQKKEKTYTDSRGPIDIWRNDNRAPSPAASFPVDYWNLIASYDTSDFKTGIIGAEAFIQVKLLRVSDSLVFFSNDLYVEIRVLEYIAGNAFVMTTAGIGHRSNLAEVLSPGQFRHVITEGQMPDRIELHARSASRINYNIGAVGDAGIFNNIESFMRVSTWVRLHR